MAATDAQGSALSVDQLRRMMTVFEASHFDKSYLSISSEFTALFQQELSADSHTSTSTSTPPSSNEHFRFLLASTLLTLLNDRFNSERRASAHCHDGFFSPLQRLTALFLAYDLYRHKAIGHHPFLPHFMRIIDDCPQAEQPEPATHKASIESLLFSDSACYAQNPQLCARIEAEFVVKLLFNRDIVVISKLSPASFTRIYGAKLKQGALEAWPDLAQISELIASQHAKNAKAAPLRALGVAPLLRHVDLDLDLRLAHRAALEPESDAAEAALRHAASVYDMRLCDYASFDPELVRPPPPCDMGPLTHHELRWLFLDEPPALCWMQQEEQEAAEAAEESKGQGGDEAVAALLVCGQSMERKLAAMEEVMARARVGGKAMVGLLVQCMEQCGAGACQGKELMQARRVRYVCAFVERLVRDDRYVAAVRDGRAEIEAFCLEFSALREATMLYQRLKKMDQQEEAQQEDRDRDEEKGVDEQGVVKESEALSAQRG